MKLFEYLEKLIETTYIDKIEVEIYKNPQTLKKF